MKANKNQKGITLVALIITIVMLLILAVVSITAIQQSGIIDIAEMAVEKYSGKSNKEEIKIKENEEIVEDHKAGGLAAKITSENYGDKINYSANGIDDWKIFYNDGKNVFIITSDWLPSIKIPEEIGMGRVENQYRTGWDSLLITEIDEEVAQKYMLSGLNTFNSEYRGFKATASLLYTEAWKTFVDTNYAVSAVGSPTLDMWVASWNAKYNDTITFEPTEFGYKVGKDEGSLGYLIAKDVMQATEGYMTEQTENLYYPRKSELADDNGKACKAYWLASPSATTGNSQGQYVMRINCDGRVYYNTYYSHSYATRPVVCLKSNVNAKLVNGIWEFN